MKNTENWIINDRLEAKPPKDLPENAFIEVVYLNGDTGKGIAKSWQQAWKASPVSGYTITKYRIMNKPNVLTRFFSFIGYHQHDLAIITATITVIVSIAVSIVLAIGYMIVNVSGWFVLMFPAISLAYLINRFRKAN